MDGQVCKKADTALSGSETVVAEGKALTCQQFVYIMLNKPKGVVSASTDRRDRTVVDLLEGAYPRRELFPAGRLDKTSTGFVLLTDDGPSPTRFFRPAAMCPRPTGWSWTPRSPRPWSRPLRRA